MPYDEDDGICCQACEVTQSPDNFGCDNCECCQSCCECYWCEACERQRDELACWDCRQCNRCGCACASDDEDGEPRAPGAHRVTLGSARSTPQFWQANKLQHKRNPTSRFIAVEIEVHGNSGDGRVVNEACAKWGAPVVADGSLPATGFEVNTSPASGDLFVQQVEEICDAIHKAAGYVTKECGLHVHVDARDYKAFELRRLVKLYHKLEPALYKLLPAERRASTYCRPCAKVFMERMEAKYTPLPKRVNKREALRLMRRQLAMNVYAPERSGATPEYLMQNVVRDRKTRKYDDARYYALNLHSYYFRGTVECRMHAGTIDAPSIVNWGVLWAGILDYAYRHTERYIDAIPGATVEQGLELLRDIAPTQEVREYIDKCWDEHGREVTV